MSYALQLAGMEPWLIPAAEHLLSQAREGIRITSVRRTRTLQARLYRRYLAGLHPYPVARPGTSMHERGLAWDMIASDQELRRLGGLWTAQGGRWGGSRDPIHFEAGARMLRGRRVVSPRVARRSTARTRRG